MRPIYTTVGVVVVVIVVGAGGFVGGWYLHQATANSQSKTTLGIIAAGSLSPNALLPSLASEYANNTPGVQAPISAQLYEGSTDAANAIIADGSQSPYDLFVAADFRVIPQHLLANSPPYATGEVAFASDPMVLAYNPSSFSGAVNGSNWYQKIVGAGITLGAPNASSDPLGYNVIFTLELEDALEGQGGALYGHFYTGGYKTVATPTAHTLYVVENDAGVALSSGEVQAYLIYQSYAKAEGLTYTTLSPLVNLGGTSQSEAANYGTVNTTILSTPTTTKEVIGAPVLFALTVPTNAPAPWLGDAFAAWLLSNATAPTWTADGFVLTPELWGYGSVGFTPPGLTPLPSYLAALI